MKMYRLNVFNCKSHTFLEKDSCVEYDFKNKYLKMDRKPCALFIRIFYISWGWGIT